MGLFKKNDKQQARYDRRVAAAQAAADRHAGEKALLVKKMKRGGRLTRDELRLARQMGLGEADPGDDSRR